MTPVFLLIILLFILDENDIVFITHRKLRKTKERLLCRKAARNLK